MSSEARPRLAAQPASLDHGREQGARLSPVRVSLGHDSCDGENGVQADQVHDRDRAHRHAEPNGGLVDRVHRYTFLEQPEGLAEVRVHHSSDQKARAITHHDGCLTNAFGQGHENRHGAGRSSLRLE